MDYRDSRRRSRSPRYSNRRRSHSRDRDRRRRSRSRSPHYGSRSYRDSRRRSRSPRRSNWYRSSSRDRNSKRYSRSRSRSPRHDNKPLPSPPPAKVTVTRDYNHGMSTPRDDNEIDLFAKGVADIERRRMKRQVNPVQMPFEGTGDQTSNPAEAQTGELNEYQSDDVSNFASTRQYSPENSQEEGGEYEGDPGDGDGGYGNGDGDYGDRDNNYYGDGDYGDDYHGNGDDHYGDQGYNEDTGDYLEKDDPRAKIFNEELEILEGNVKPERTYYGLGFSCDVCNISLTSVAALQTHFAGARHKKALARRGMSQELDHLVKPPKDEKVRESIMRCTLCNVIVQGWEINVHTQSPRHQEMLMSVPHSTTSISSETDWYVPVVTARDDFTITDGQYECTLCAVTLPEKSQYENHVLGKRHQKRLRWKFKNECDPDEGLDNGAQFHCSVCNISCCSSLDLDNHFSGRLHARMLRTKGVSEEEIKQGLEESTPIFPTARFEVKQEEKKPNKSFKLDPEVVRPKTGFKLKPTLDKPKKGLYGSLPQLLEKESDIQPSSTNTYRSSKQNNSNPRHNPLSVGAFLQSLKQEKEEEPRPLPPPKVEPVELVPVEVVKDNSVSQFMGKVSFQHSFQSAVKPSTAPRQQQSVVDQLAARHQALPPGPLVPMVQYPLPKGRRYGRSQP